MGKPTAKLIWIAIEELHFLRRNPQYLSPHAMEALKASIQRDGFLAPVLVRPYKAGGYELLSGNHRAMAAKELGMKSVPAIVSALNDQQAQRVAVNLNTVAMSKIQLTDTATSMVTKMAEGNTWTMRRFAPSVN